jgi:hypothetical protein
LIREKPRQCKWKKHWEIYENSKQISADHLGGYWKGFEQAPRAITKWDTGVDVELLRFIGAASVKIPENFVKN